MKKYFLHFLFFLFATSFSYGQQTRTLKTVVVDNFKFPIANVNVTVYEKADSNFVTSQISDKKGILQLFIDKSLHTFCVFQKDSFAKQIFYIENENIKLPDTIILHKVFSDKEVSVFASPIIVKEDTIQFNNELFKKDSLKTLEEVLKKFPGVTIDREGNIEINGTKVEEMLLEGKPLPFKDLKQLTQTLQASAIDKIQFIDRKSDESRISKVNDGKVSKVINIKLKSKTRKSLNQSYYAGVGNNNRFESNAIVNYLYNDFYSNANVNYSNTGRSNYGSINYFNPNGLSTGLNSNFSARYSPNAKWTIGANLGITNQENIFEETRDRVIFLKDSLNFYNQELRSENTTTTYSLNSNMEYKKDSLTEVRSNLNLNTNRGNRDRNEYFNTASNSKKAINKGQRINVGEFKNASISFNINGSKRSKNDQFSFFPSMSFNMNNFGDDTYQFNDIFYFRTTSTTKDTTKQLINNSNKNYTFRANLNMYKKIFKELRLNVGVSLSKSNRPTLRQAFFYNYNTKLYETPNLVLYNDNLNLTNIFTQTMGLAYKYKAHSIVANINLNQQINENIDKKRDTTLLQNNKFVTPSLNYTFYNKYLTINNSTSLVQRNPTSQQLLPIVDNSNPLYIRKGNPALKNEQTFNVNTSINKRPTKKGLSYTFTNYLNFTNNRISNNTFFDANDGKQVVTYINLPKVYTNNATVFLNKYVERYKLNYHIRYVVLFSKDNNYLNGELNKLTNFSMRPSIGIKQNQKKYFFDYTVGYLYQTNTYSLRPNQNIKLGSFTTDASIGYMAIKNWEFKIDYQQSINNNQRSLQKINNLNSNISYTKKYKKSRITYSFQAFDILNQNSNLRQNINDFYEEYVNTIAIRRFFLFTVQVNINKFRAGTSQKGAINRNFNKADNGVKQGIKN